MNTTIEITLDGNSITIREIGADPVTVNISGNSLESAAYEIGEAVTEYLLGFDGQTECEMNFRILIEEGFLDEAVCLLDANGIENDLDDGDRIMVSGDDVAESCAVLENAGIDYELI